MEINGKRILRVFPRRTKAAPKDEYALYGPPPLIRKEVDEIHISCTFTYDKGQAEYLHRAYQDIYTDIPVLLGGPVYDTLDSPAAEFTPGLYLAKGQVITSRGCPWNCSYCYVPKREGPIKELEVYEGYHVLDNNILATSEKHQMAVWDMLLTQFAHSKERPIFTGGMDSFFLTKEIADQLKRIKTARMFFAYDKAAGREPLRKSGEVLKAAGFSENHCFSYVLVGYKDDTFEKAEERMRYCWSIGFTPFAMLYRDDEGVVTPGWKEFANLWLRTAVVRKLCKTGEKPNYNFNKLMKKHEGPGELF